LVSFGQAVAGMVHSSRKVEKQLFEKNLSSRLRCQRAGIGNTELCSGKGCAVLSTSLSYRMISTDLTKSLKRTATKTDVARDSKYYLDNIGKVKTIDDFLNNKRLYSFAMKAFGLQDMTYATGFMKKVLTEGVSSSSSFANKLADTKYKDFATAFDFKTYGKATTATDATQKPVVDKYVRQILEEDAGSQDEGVRLALYFQRQAPTIKSAYNLLADKALLQVTQTAMGFSPYMSMASIDKQYQMINSKFNVKDFQDPVKLQKFLTRFTANWDAENASSSTSLSNTILIGSQKTYGLGIDVLSSLQNIKIGKY
jgi:hypothetical protein